MVQVIGHRLFYNLMPRVCVLKKGASIRNVMQSKKEQPWYAYV